MPLFPISFFLAMDRLYAWIYIPATAVIRCTIYCDHMGRKERGTLVENKACVPVFPDDHILPYRI